VSVKYITKNTKTDVSEFFLEIKNHRSASIISSKNLRLIATRVCIARESGSRFLPLKNMVSVIAAIREKEAVRIMISSGGRLNPDREFIIKAVTEIRIVNSTSKGRYLKSAFIGAFT
jgi:hypothetical protein